LYFQLVATPPLVKSPLDILKAIPHPQTSLPAVPLAIQSELKDPFSPPRTSAPVPYVRHFFQSARKLFSPPFSLRSSVYAALSWQVPSFSDITLAKCLSEPLVRASATSAFPSGCFLTFFHCIAWWLKDCVERMRTLSPSQSRNRFMTLPLRLSFSRLGPRRFSFRRLLCALPYETPFQRG